jgi:iron complex outermembrane receptor protein
LLPAFAIEKIEVLRDGASAQYGSDAIAGVININVKKATNKFDIALCGKPNFKGSNDHRGGNDGNNAQVDMNYGTSLGKEKVSSMQLQVSIKRQTGRAKDATGNLFNAFNAIEQELPKQELISIAYLA